MLSISVDPALTLGLVRVFAALACIALSGFLLVYFAFGLRHPLTALATALPMGLASTLLVSNLLAYVIGSPRALTLGLLIVLATSILIAFCRRKLYLPTHPLAWQDAAIFIGAGIAILYLSVVNYVVYPVWEYSTHFWLANTIRFGNFPVMAPGAPNLLAEYHYGAAFLAATLAHIGQVDSAIVFFILAPIVATSAYLAAAAVATQVLKHIRLGLLAALFFSFGAGMPFLVEPARSVYLRWITPNLIAAQELLADTLETVASAANSQYPRYLIDPHFLLAVAVLFSVIVLATHLASPGQDPTSGDPPWHSWVLLGTLFAGVALIESLVFTLGIIGWGAYALWHSIRMQTLSHLKRFILAAAPSALLATFQGGILTSTLFSSATGGTGLSTAFRITLTPLPFAFGHPLQQFAFPPPWIAFYLISFGLPLLFAPILLVWAIRSKHSVPLVWLIAIGIVGMLVPHIAIYHFNTLLRWLNFGHASLAFLLGIGALLLASRIRRQWLGGLLFLACASLTVGWPLAISVSNTADARVVTLGQSTESHWTISPLHRQSDNQDWITGRPYTFFMGAEARQFLRSLPASARVLTNSFPEVPLLVRGLVPHKNVDSFSYTYFHYPGPTYLDALFALDPFAMRQLGITHIVINHRWFRHTPLETHALLQDERYFSLIFSDEDINVESAWYRVYEVLPAFYDSQPESPQDLVRTLSELVPSDASVYVSPAIPADLRWPLLYALRDSHITSALLVDNHINTRLEIAEPRPDDKYDFALLAEEPLGERWLNWAFAPQDLPSTWGVHPSQRLWHALGVELYALKDRHCPYRSVAGAPAHWQLSPNVPTTLNLDCLMSDTQSASGASSLLLTVLASNASTVEVQANRVAETISLEPGATLIPLQISGNQHITLTPTAQVWVRAQIVPAGRAKFRSGIPALLVLPSFKDQELDVGVHFYGERAGPLENQVVWEFVKQRRIYGHWWHWDSPSVSGAWRLMLGAHPNHGSSYRFHLDFPSLTTTVSVDGQPTSVPWEPQLPVNPGEPYVLYFTLFQPGARVQSMPVAWISYGPEEDPTALLAPRFILLDEELSQE